MRRALPLALAALIFALAGYVVNVTMARQLGPAEFGILGLVMSLVSLANVVQASGVPQAISSYAARNRKAARAVLGVGLRLQLAVSLMLMAILALMSPVASRVFDEPRLDQYLLIAVLMLPTFGAMTAFSGYWNGAQAFDRQALVIIAYALAKVLLIIGLASQYGVVGAVVGYALSPIGGMAAGFRLPARSAEVRARMLAAISFPIICLALTTLLLYSVDLYVVKIFVEDRSAVGHYVAAQSVALVPYLALAAFGQVLLPRVAHFVGADDINGARLSIEEGLRQVLFLLVPGIAIIASTAPEIIELLYGDQYRAAGPVLRYLVIAYGILSVLGFFASALIGAGETYRALMASVVGLVVTVGAALVLVPVLELTGAALSVAVGASIGTMICAHRLRQVIGFGLGRVRTLRVCAAGAIAVGVGLLPLPGSAVLGQWILGGCLALLGAAALGELSPAERRRIRGWLRMG